MTSRLLLLSLALALEACSEQTYSAEDMCGGRLPNWLAPSDGIGHLRVLLPVTVTEENVILWNNKEISEARLGQYLRLMREMDPSPQLVLRVENGASCKDVKGVRTKIDRTLDCKGLGVCGEGTGWRHWPGAKPVA